VGEIKASIIIGIRNRSNHFSLTFPFNISQVGTNYELIYVNFNSTDDCFSSLLLEHIKKYEDIFSSNLLSIKEIYVKDVDYYNPSEAKNLGACFSKSEILCFNDADTILGMSYLNKWSEFVELNQTFVTNRCQESMASKSKRILDNINYGNLLVSRKDFLEVLGFDESRKNYGGDDDDIFHRLKLSGLREINPYSHKECNQYSILHGDNERLSDLEVPERCDPEVAFDEIYKNKQQKSRKNDYLFYNNFKSLKIYSRYGLS